MGRLSAAIVALSVCGVVFSCYAIHVERSKHSNESYRAHCDLDSTIACSHVLTSKYSVGLGLVEGVLGSSHFLNIPNSYFGLLFFPMMLVLGLSSSKTILFCSLLLCFTSCLTSVYLIYVLLFIMQKVCLVCIAIHLINFLQFTLFTIKWRTTASGSRNKNTEKQTKKVQ